MVASYPRAAASAKAGIESAARPRNTCHREWRLPSSATPPGAKPHRGAARHGDELIHVDISAADDQRGRAARGDLAGKQSRDAEGGGTLGDDALLPQEMRHAAIDLCLADQHDIVEQAA